MLHPGGWAPGPQAALEQLAPLNIHQLMRGRQHRVALARFRLPATAEAHATAEVLQECVPAKVQTRSVSGPGANRSMMLQLASLPASTPACAH